MLGIKSSGLAWGVGWIGAALPGDEADRPREEHLMRVGYSAVTAQVP